MSELPEMTISDFIAARSRMENRMANALRTIADEFEAETGRTPSSIYINVNEVPGLGRTVKKYYVTDVETHVDLN
jgi:hypothetical protein